MSPTVERIIAEIDALPPDERGELANAFLISLERSADVALAWEAEVRGRLAEMRAQFRNGIPAKELFAELRQKATM